MRLHRLYVQNFAAVREADVTFGPGLNVLYGPNDIGKSTLVDAIRLALLLPHSSSASEQYISWIGGREPVVELTFESERQRIWRVRKEFGKGGLSVLRESKNGQDFDNGEHGRRVDGKIREILGWGIPEPGGTGGGIKGLPVSFLATALLSTQGAVDAVLRESLQADPISSGKEKIAAALQAVAQDPLFVSILRIVQSRRDEAYTDKGAKKTGKNSVFRIAAERVNETRQEKERLRSVVDDSEGTERQLRDLTSRRDQHQEKLATAKDKLVVLETLVKQSTEREAAAEQVRIAKQDVDRVRKLMMDITDAEEKAAALAAKETEAKEAMRIALVQLTEAEEALRASEDAARAAAGTSADSEMVLRHQLESRKTAAEHRVMLAQQRINIATDALNLVKACAEAGDAFREQQAIVNKTHASFSKAADQLKRTTDDLAQCDALERALDIRIAQNQLAGASADADRQLQLTAQLEPLFTQQTLLDAQRSSIKVPTPAELASIRRLATDLASARGALDVGLRLTLSPTHQLDLQVRKDAGTAESISSAQPIEIDATAAIELIIPTIALIQVRGGRRDAEDRVQTLEDRWNREVLPHLTAAGATNLEELDLRISAFQELGAKLNTCATEVKSLQLQTQQLSDASERLKEASQRLTISRSAFGEADFERLQPDLGALGPDPVRALRERRQHLSLRAEPERSATNQAEMAYNLAQQRADACRTNLESTVSKRDIALAAFSEGAEEAFNMAQADLLNATQEKENVANEFASLESTISAREQRIQAEVSGAIAKKNGCKRNLDDAQVALTAAISASAKHGGILIQLRKQRDAEDLPALDGKLNEAVGRYNALPEPECRVTSEEVSAANNFVNALQSELDVIQTEIQQTQGALRQVGGAVARERLRDATEAFELAIRQEREIEADYEAWKLLLDQMKEADAAQASNLGQVLAPAIATRFQTLTNGRYESLRLNPELATEGVVVRGTPKPPSRLSVGTREQLSTLYRLALGEYLKTPVVLDDQLVQSDDIRMEWFRTLLTEKAREFQIIVFTCRPADYLAPLDMLAGGTECFLDSDDGFIRAIDLDRALSKANSDVKVTQV